MPYVALIQRPDDMLSSPLRSHSLDYEPPQGFVIPAFATYNGSADPYNHMLHYNQAMILNVNNDRLLCYEKANDESDEDVDDESNGDIDVQVDGHVSFFRTFNQVLENE